MWYFLQLTRCFVLGRCSVLRHGLVYAASGLVLVIVAPPAAWAQTKATSAWPAQPLTLVVGFGKNSTSEVVASTLAAPLAARLGVPVNIETVGGKAGTNAAAKVAAATDGHTIGIVVNNALTVADLVDARLSYKPERDLRPLAFLSDDAMVLMASNAVASATPQEFMLSARNADAKWTYGSQGAGSIGHLATEYLAVKANMHPVHKPFPGGPEAASALKSNAIQLALLPTTLSRRVAQEGGGKMVAVTSRNRSAQLPDVPTLHEAGVLGFDLRIWSVAIAPRSMPDGHVQRLSREISQVMATPEVVQKLASSGLTVPADTSAEQAGREVRRETAVLGGIVIIRSIQVGD